MHREPSWGRTAVHQEGRNEGKEYSSGLVLLSRELGLGTLDKISIAMMRHSMAESGPSTY